MGKIFKIIIGIVLFFLVALISIPFLFQDKIVTLIKETVNENVNAKVNFSDASLSLLRNFPKASLKLEDVAVTNFEPFEGDTLFYAGSINLKIKLTDIFKNIEEELNINSFSIDNALINVIVDESGKANYDIAKTDNTATTETETETTPSSFNLSLDSYAIENTTIKYTDKQAKMIASLFKFNHSGTGDFSQQNIELDTKTSTAISFEMNKSSYMKNVHLDLDAVLAMDLANNKYSFLKNEAHINQLPLIFNGFVKLNETNQEIAIDFKTPSSDFRNFLALIPEEYAKNIADVKTTGDFSVIGKVNGIVSETTIPKLDIVVASNNASFKYPDLPKSVDNININAQIKNTTGFLKNTAVNLEKLHFKIDDNEFDGKVKVQNVTENPYIDATVKGTLNLAHITKVYPIEMAKELSGVITANLNSTFDMDAVTNNKYDRIKNNGTMEINNFLFDGKDVANPLKINNAKVVFKPQKISLTNFDALTGDTDLKATGSIDNLLGFLLSDKNLEGNFSLNSNTFKMSDFMTTETVNPNSPKETESSNQVATEETLKIPAFLDCTINANAKEVYYDNLKLENVQGKLILKDQKATLENVKGNMLGGEIALNGAVNTKEKTPLFDMNLGINSFDITETFKSIEMFNMLSPIASIFKGKLNTNVNLSGDLKDDFTPNLNSISGKALAEILSSNISPEESPALSLLNDKLSFVDLDKLNIDDLKTNITFDQGKVKVEPFTVKYKDIDIAIGGTHSIDQTMAYNATFNVPAKYLGSEATGLLSKLDASNENILVPVTANILGSFTKPNINTNLKSAIGNLTTQLVQQQKNKLVNNALGGLLGSSSKDSTKTSTKAKLGNALGGLLTKKKDTASNKTDNGDVSANKEAVKEKAVEKVGNVLNGLFSKKKK